MYYIADSEQVLLTTDDPLIIAIKYIKSPSKEMQLNAVKNCGFVIQYIKRPFKEVQLEAIKQCPNILNNISYFIKTPCKEIKDMLMIKDIIE